MAVALNKRMWGMSRLSRQQVTGAKQRGVNSYSVVIILCLCLVSLALFQVWLRLQAVRLGYVLSTTSKLETKLKQENGELKLELATLTSPEHLEEMARLRLGLRDPEKGQVVVLP